jgi:meso-butanediol dehydrogenase/(S,S)-butanediol dehydrogenase/diacetyl reductase
MVLEQASITSGGGLILRLRGKRGFVTGAGGGIGRAIALEMVREGADVYLTDLDLPSVNGVADDARHTRRDARVASGQLDVRDTRSINSGINEAVRLLGGIDIAVNCAGVSTIKPFLTLQESDWDHVMATNAKGVFLCCQALVALMIKNQVSGSIVNIASSSGKKGSRLLTHYSASKAAAIALSQALALEFAPQGIRVNAVCPGYVKTPMQDREARQEAETRAIEPQDVLDGYVNSVPLGRLAEPEDVAHVVVFLLSDASSYMTGQSLNVTGGKLLT